MNLALSHSSVLPLPVNLHGLVTVIVPPTLQESQSGDGYSVSVLIVTFIMAWVEVDVIALVLSIPALDDPFTLRVADDAAVAADIAGVATGTVGDEPWPAPGVDVPLLGVAAVAIAFTVAVATTVLDASEVHFIDIPPASFDRLDWTCDR